MPFPWIPLLSFHAIGAFQARDHSAQVPRSVMSSNGASASAECSITIVARLPEITIPFFGQYGLDAPRSSIHRHRQPWTLHYVRNIADILLPFR